MWKTTQSGIDAMLGAAALAPTGQRREDALDALNAWIGSPIRAQVIVDSGGSDVVLHNRVHSGGMTRVGERLIVPSSGWTVQSHQPINPTSDIRIRIRSESHLDRFVDLSIGTGKAGSISGPAAQRDTLALDLEITAYNIDDAEPGDIPAPPADFLHRIYDNIDAPVSVRPSLVGMHFTDPDSLGGDPVPPTAPVNVTLPAITGTPAVGQTLAASNGTWTGSPTPTYAYQWLRGGSNISGATSATYLLVEADIGANISCRVTATNTSGSADATSSAVGPIEAAGAPSGPDWYSLVDATNPSAMYHNANLSGQPVVNGNRVGAVLDTSGNGNHWREWDGDSTRPEYVSANGGFIEITDNYHRGMAIDGTNRLVDVRKAFWVVMAIKRGGPINAHAVLMDKDYVAGGPGGAQLAAGLDASGLFCEKLINNSTVGPIVSASAITTSAWGVVSFGYDGTNLTARVNLNTKGSVADTRSLPDEDGAMVLRLGGNTPSILHYKAVGFLDYYPGTDEEAAGIAEIAALAGVTL